MCRIILGFVGAIISGLLGLAHACPDTNLPASSTLQLDAGFGFQIQDIEIGSGVDLAACSDLPSDLNAAGFVAAQPSLSLSGADLTSGPFSLGARSQCDTVLLVRDPAGTFHFSDDEGSSTQPLINLPGGSGDYLIWLGKYDATAECEVKIAVTPVDQACPISGAPIFDSVPVTRQDLTNGITLPVSAGGDLDLSGCNSLGDTVPDLGLVGFTGVSPHFGFTGASDLEGTVVLTALGQCDTSLLALDSQGNWYFNDDFGDEFTPQLDLPASVLADLKIWVGAYDYEAEGCSVNLDISSEASGGDDNDPEATAGSNLCPVAGMTADNQIDLENGGAIDPVSLVIGGGQDIENCSGDVIDIFAVGFFDAPPDLDLTVNGDLPGGFNIITQSACDAVMLIQDPDGQWHFDDDTNVADPALSFSNPIDGTYSIWIGTYEGDMCDSLVSINTADSQTCPNPDLPGKEEYSYTSNEISDGIRHPVIAGGNLSLRSCSAHLGSMGDGFFIDRPDFVFDLGLETQQQIQFESDATCDTVLLVQDSKGDWLYDDDGGPGEVGAARVATLGGGGLYKVWLGTFEEELCESGVTVKRTLFKE